LEVVEVKVILRENVINLGDMGTVVNVSPGYARNFLFPRNLAIDAGSGNAKQLEHTMREIRKHEEKHRAILREVAKKVEGLVVEVTARAGVEDKLFGSVTSVQIAEKLREMGQEIDRRMIVIHDPIKTLGTHKVTVKLGNGVDAALKVSVKKIEEEAPAVEEVEAEEAVPAAVADAEEAKESE
jgi:large subunit ribosomal protein L9